LWGLMPIEFHRDGPWEIPGGWVWARLGGVCRETGRIDPARHMQGEFTYIDLSAVDDGRIGKAQHLPVDKAPSRARQPVASGDTLLSCVRVYLRNNALVPPELDGAVASTAFCVLRPTNALHPKFLFWFIHFRKFTETLIPLQRGNSPPAVLDDDVRDQWMPVPPLAEQRRIVARIDELFTEIADGETALTRARDDLDTWRRALLKAAVTGELTREWREHNKPNETASDFLTHIREARSDHGDNRNRVAPPAFDTSDLPELPEGWSWAALPALCVAAQRNGISIKGTPSPPGVMALRLNALTDHGLNFGAVRYIPLAAERLPNYLVKEHDFLVSRANGSEELVGRAVYVANIVQETVFPDTIIRYPLYPSEVLGRWIELAWKSPITRRQIGLKSKTTAGILKISQDDIAQIAIPIPPEVEMRAAIDAIHLNAENSIEGVGFITSSVRDAKALRQSILKAAFEGHLVEQDPSDEPAERLLARLNDDGRQPIPAFSRGRRSRGSVGADA
jgi:type I restriction enzyme, S subunit